MNITDAFVRVLAETVTIGNGILNVWVNMPANVASPLDANATLGASGKELVGYIASSAARASDILCALVGALF